MICNYRFNKLNEGWTFIETLIVIAIVLILTSSVGFMSFRYIDKAKTVTGRSQIETFTLALNSYFFDTRSFPTASQGLAALWEEPRFSPIPEGWRGPYLDKPVPQDPWGNEYEYQVPGPHNLPFGIRSLGADGLQGGSGIMEDISSWEN
ncbi:MAG: type II secretion system major pseudopilin GspG [Spirochaetales bacterium]|nr:type II secretion system major pseudopilin GspG [Spirochaetales bacterium]